MPHFYTYTDYDNRLLDCYADNADEAFTTLSERAGEFRDSISGVMSEAEYHRDRQDREISAYWAALGVD